MSDIEAFLLISMLESMAERKDERSSMEPLCGMRPGRRRLEELAELDILVGGAGLWIGRDTGELLKLLMLEAASPSRASPVILDEEPESVRGRAPEPWLSRDIESGQEAPSPFPFKFALSLSTTGIFRIRPGQIPSFVQILFTDLIS